MIDNQEKFDVAVIGAGPAGMIAAIASAESGAKTILLEKNRTLGRKLLITGKGRCNVTQAEYDPKNFIEKIGSKGKFLFSALNIFGVRETRDFFEGNGVALKEERGGRMFPASDQAEDVLSLLSKTLKERGVKILTGREVLGFEKTKGKIINLKTKQEKIFARNYIIATGGKSYPVTGSSGDGYTWAKEMGHTIIRTSPALVPIKTREEWIPQLQGLSLKNVKVSVFQNNKKQDERFGEMLFTHFGLSGPIILDMSKKVGALLLQGEVFLEIDFKPALDFVQMDKRLQRDFERVSNKDFKNYLPELIPQKMIDVLISLSKIRPDRKINSITKLERKNLVKLLKNLKVTVERLMGYEYAIVTSGGVELREVDSRTMRSKKVENLFLAGEVLDIDGPTGGYNLQICWSTGNLAGRSAAKMSD